MTAPPSYPKGDIRRMLMTIAAIDALGWNATLSKVAERTGLDKKTVIYLLATATPQAGVLVEKSGVVYRIVDWGPVIKKKGAEMALKGAFDLPPPSRTSVMEAKSVNQENDGHEEEQVHG